MKNEILDFVAVGLGPFNLSLACLSDTVESLNGIFFEKRDEFNWHPGMMIEGVTLQTPFLSDLVTLAEPTHPLSFLAYKKQKGEIYSFYIRESFFLDRVEYNLYCQWAIEQLSNVKFNHEVQHIEFDTERKCYVVQVYDAIKQETKSYFAQHLVLGTGPSPWMPQCCYKGEDTVKSGILHSSEYLYNKDVLKTRKAITVVGGGQSAAEIFYDLLQEIDIYDYELHWLTRSPRYFPLEYTKLTLEMTSPEYVDYFYNLPSFKRDELVKKQSNLYKGINSELINAIYDLIYTKNLVKSPKLIMNTNSELSSIHQTEHQLSLDFYHSEQEKNYTVNTDSVILATGYKYQEPKFLQSIAHKISRDEKQRFDVGRNYTIDKEQESIFVQNAELHTHGFVTPDLGMACYRNSIILNQIAKKEIYRVEKKIAFQSFGVDL